jgi:hypothetical protein
MGLKKKFFFGAVLLLTCAVCLSACGKDTTIAATIDGRQIPAGVYIYYQYQAYYEANSKVAEEAAATTTAPPAEADTPLGSLSAAEAAPAETVVTVPLLKNTIGGEPVTEWINDEAIASVREFIAVEEKFAELGIPYTDNNDRTAIASVEQNWESYAAELEKLGIGKSSYLAIVLNSVKRYELFKFYYGKDGPNPVSDDEIKGYLLENNARIDYIPIELKDGAGNLLKSDGKAERLTMAEDYLKRAEAGEPFDTLLTEYNDYYTALQAAALPPTDPAAEGEETDPAAADPAAAIATLPSSYETVISKSGTTPSASVVTRVFEEQAANPGVTKFFIVEDAGGEYYYVVELLDLFSDATYLDSSRESVISELKADEFDELITSWTADQTYALNDKAIKRYKAEKFEELT